MGTKPSPESLDCRGNPGERSEPDCPSKTGECRIRTCEGISHQIYSLTPLTARETPPLVFVCVRVRATDQVFIPTCTCDAGDGASGGN